MESLIFLIPRAYLEDKLQHRYKIKQMKKNRFSEELVKNRTERRYSIMLI